MSLHLGGLGERVRNYLNGRHALPHIEILPTVQPVMKVERLVNDWTIRRAELSLAQAGNVDLITVPKDKDVVLHYFDLRNSDWTIQEMRVLDDEGNTILLADDGDPILHGDYRNVCPLRLDAGWTLQIEVDSSGSCVFDAIYEWYPARSDAGVP